ncbi:hypothetical protein T01_8595 [Trichinella spiralis]|uniref:Uncharacterized protein n=1 Tax=Trichinella spiralis TaxID=6334 RepID=A0A0V1B9J5_TRISP|nr:hypothetical protein T01_8595 [Trichinella spiralis]
MVLSQFKLASRLIKLGISLKTESFHYDYDYDAIFEQYHAMMMMMMMMMMIVLCKHVTQCNAHSFQSHDHYNGHMLEDGCTFFGFWCWQE